MDLTLSQNPQCEGFHQDRYLFNSKVSFPSPIPYVPRYDRYDPNADVFVINAGIAHDVTDGAQFAFYDEQEPNPRKNLLGTYVVDKAGRFRSTMKAVGDLSIPVPSLPPHVVAFQTKLGQGTNLRIYVHEHPPPGQHKRDLILQACGHDLFHTEFVDSRDEAHLEVAIQENRVVITVRDTKATQCGHYRLPTRVITLDQLGPFLGKARSFYRELDRCGIDADIIENVDVEFFKLQETPPFLEHRPGPELMPSSGNLFQDGVIDLGVEDGSFYGIRLTNNGAYDLYFTLSYFDGSNPTYISGSFCHFQ